MQFNHSSNISLINKFLLSETEQVFNKVKVKTTEEPVFRFNFFMLVRLHDAVLGVEYLLEKKDHRPLLYSMINILRPILIDMAYSGTLHKIFNTPDINQEILLRGAKFIQELLVSETQKIKKYASKTTARMGVDWSVGVQEYLDELNNSFMKYYPTINEITNEYHLQIEKIFEYSEKDMPHLIEVWDIYKIYSQMTHINDVYGEQQKSSIEAKSLLIYQCINLLVDHFAIIVRTIACLPDHKTNMLKEYNRIHNAILNLNPKVV